MPSQIIGKNKDKTFFHKKWKFNLTMFGYIIYVIATDNMKKSLEKEKFTGLTDEDIKSSAAWHFPVRDQGKSFVFLNLNSDINEIVHESTHVMQSIVEWIGAAYKEREFIAYLMAHITQGIYEFLESCKKSLDKKDNV